MINSNLMMQFKTNSTSDDVESTVFACTMADCYGNETQELNVSVYNITQPYEYVCIMEPLPEEIFLIYFFHTCVYIMYGVIFILALCGNGLVCYIVQSSPRMKTVTNFFIMNLAVGDTLMTLFCIPFSFVSMLILRYWPFGAVMCKIVHYSQAVSVLVSAYTLLAISIDRYFVIMRPLKPRLGKMAAKLVMGGVWCGALATAAPIPIVSELHKPSLWHQVCGLDICSERWARPEQNVQYTWALMMLQFVLPLLALICTYGRIAYVVWGVRPPGEAESVRDSRIQYSKRKMVKMMIMVVVVFTVCWLPLNMFIILWMAHEDDEDWGKWPGMPYVWFVCHWLAMSHSCYNPVIYCYMNVQYRNGFKQVLEKVFRLNNNADSRACQGLQLSELVGVNRVAERRTSLQCQCYHRRTFCSVMDESRKCTSSSLRHYRSETVQRAAPPRAVSLRLHFE